MKILVRRGQFINKGAEAMVRTVQTELGRRIPGATFAIPHDSLFPNTTPLAEQAGLKTIGATRNPRKLGKLLIAQWLRRPWRIVGDISSRDELEQGLVMRQVDAVIDIAGYAYGDTWGTKRAIQSGACARAAAEQGKPYFYLPQAWGPFDDLENQAAFRAACRPADLVCARDQQSLEHLQGLLGRNGAPLDLKPDIAFRFQGLDRQFGRTVFAEMGVDLSLPIIGVSPNQKMYERAAGVGTENAYIAKLVELCRFARRLGAAVVLLPHDIQPNDMGCYDDRLSCSLVVQGTNDPQVKAMTRRLPAEGIKSLIANCDLVVGSRFHALVAALSQGIPAMALGWSHKYLELLRPFGLEKFVVGIENLDTENLQELLAELWRDRAGAARGLTAPLEKIRRDVDQLFDRVADRIAGRRALAA
jgi:polysaccharide pyruvyl transferase WcaK-like protein